MPVFPVNVEHALPYLVAGVIRNCQSDGRSIARNMILTIMEERQAKQQPEREHVPAGGFHLMITPAQSNTYLHIG